MLLNQWGFSPRGLLTGLCQGTCQPSVVMNYRTYQVQTCCTDIYSSLCRGIKITLVRSSMSPISQVARLFLCEQQPAGSTSGQPFRHRQSSLYNCCPLHETACRKLATYRSIAFTADHETALSPSCLIYQAFSLVVVEPVVILL